MVLHLDATHLYRLLKKNSGNFSRCDNFFSFLYDKRHFSSIQVPICDVNFPGYDLVLEIVPLCDPA